MELNKIIHADVIEGLKQLPDESSNMNKKYNHLKGNRHAKGNSPNKTSFKKGNIPWNKNKKGIHLSKATEFKKGCESIRRLKIGTITIRIDKNKKNVNLLKLQIQVNG